MREEIYSNVINNTCRVYRNESKYIGEKFRAKVKALNLKEIVGETLIQNPHPHPDRPYNGLRVRSAYEDHMDEVNNNPNPNVRDVAEALNEQERIIAQIHNEALRQEEIDQNLLPDDFNKEEYLANYSPPIIYVDDFVKIVPYDAEFYNTSIEDEAFYEYEVEELFFEDGKLIISNNIIKEEKKFDQVHFNKSKVVSSIIVDFIEGNYSMIGSLGEVENNIANIEGLLIHFSEDIKQNMAQWIISKAYLGMPLYRKHNLLQVILAWFIKFHNIKCNDWYFTPFYRYNVRLFELERNEMHLTNTLMEKFELIGEKCRKLINSYDVDLHKVAYLQSILGIDFFNKIHNEVLVPFVSSGLFLNNVTLPEIVLSKTSKNKIIRSLYLINYDLLKDHIDMAIKLKDKYNFSFTFAYRDRKEFDKEHALLGKLLVELSEKDEIVIDYDPEIINKIEEPIEVGKDLEFEVKLLSSKSDYKEEGIYQSHCVGGYVNHSCHIISLRNKSTRCTIEYTYNGERRQTKMKNNQLPDQEWLDIINILDDRVTKLIKDKVLEPKKFTTIQRSFEEIISRSEIEQLVNQTEEP